MEDDTEAYLFFGSVNNWMLTTGSNYRADKDHAWFNIYSTGSILIVELKLSTTIYFSL